MGCADVCLMMDYENDNVFHSATTRKARKSHRCCECGDCPTTTAGVEAALAAASGAQSADDALRHFAHDLASKQQPMDPECRDVLYNNLGELLSDDASGAADTQNTETSP